MSLAGLPPEAGALVEGAGIAGGFCLVPLPGGANNRVFRVDVKGHARAVIKSYFMHPADPRDRVGAEYKFSVFAWSHGVRGLPQPLGCDLAHRLGMYEYIDGWLPTASEVTEDAVDEALEFYRAVNRYRQEPDAAALPAGSEACFSVDDHLAAVERRVRRLDAVGTASAVDRDALRFARGELSPTWEAVARAVRAGASALPGGLEAQLAPEERCISPSDFGFHNALRARDGLLRFIDFEYAGWDDPAKMVCDFFCQPKVPVPLAHFDRFAEAATATVARPEAGLRRAWLLLPAYQVKWSCILLNDFLPAGGSRRRFAIAEGEEDQRKAAQLGKARRALEAVG